MFSAIQKLILIPALAFSVGYLFAQSEHQRAYNSDDYPEHLAGAFTGGFNEQTCQSCHFDYDLNKGEGRFSVSGIPNKIQPGKAYKFEIIVEREDLGKAGFQLSSRVRDGRQAGVFEISENERLMFTEQVPDSLQYVQHSTSGTVPTETGKNRWVVKWHAPEFIEDSIYFNIAANAANGDQSEFGDWIYAKEYVVPGE
ncbi:MAG: hypothetical protein HUJ22_07285 [Gracilimonas sp.]|uniref:choice-of-anchor V domain-containing protein n=1 Tax=Gracilimonas sp. TaxID=1974203 RepID=UPI0019A6119B|nr:choice-of-anchor V domain-containing protein [Gracilimonas sp.]MBD3616360.1 hypothetical protein [Gracilimonas sp.]